MTLWIVIGFIIWTLAVAVVMFFVGGKHKENLLRTVGLLRETAETVAATIREAKKKL